MKIILIKIINNNHININTNNNDYNYDDNCYDNSNYSNHDNYYKFENYYYVDNDENNGKHNNIQNIKIISKILFKRNSNHNLSKKIIILKIKISDEIILISLK